MSVMHTIDDVLVWRFATPLLAIASAPVGGGIGMREWVVNAQVPRDYSRTDIDAHLASIAARHACDGTGVGMLTAARVARCSNAHEGGVRVHATVGVSSPTWAAVAPDPTTGLSAWRPGTINVVAFVPARLDDSALVNAVMTVTEAKSQALLERCLPGTGTATDAVCVVCDPHDDTHERFAGPRSRIGAPLARAVHAAVLARLDAAQGAHGGQDADEGARR
jgi:adenosylcobinamide amidohydrolase